ncbi:hypothetical protein TSAR_003896 [Trichomalopsis sarcophagae]|uniref:Uncharacterized protein n=1 Tax=Trichomalopsis sarcophagae TaxID=543379 RepID=A0A232EZC4_9HYME|nr:hypothetical protein TSAR_003896 [Trichomalopsis sarcophagae]
MSARNSLQSQALYSGWEVRKSRGGLDNSTEQGEKAGKGALEIWNTIWDAERERKSIWKKIQDRLDSMDHVVSNASNIHKSVKSDPSTIKIQVKRLKREQEELEKSKENLELMLSKAEDRQ